MRNLKKVISSVAALAIVASSASAFAVTFPDVDSSASYANAVNALVGLGIVNGDDNGLFNPDNQVTRAEFTKMAVGALGESAAAEAQTTSQFNDAANTTVHWAAGYIAQGVSDGFINGYDDTTFGPDDQVTYAQACKMLVAAIGYTTYAENQGGYPAGYVAQANTLGITAGVSATNDTNLTRAQVATLIYNATDVPLCVIDSWETNVNYATGELINTPVLKKLDGKEGRDYQTLLTERHDAYKVKGRVMANSKGSSAGLDKDEVTYRVESTDNYDDNLTIDKDHSVSETMKVGTTSAADMLFEYTEALVQIDEDSDEVTILAIESYGNSKTITIKADDVADDDSTIGKAYTDFAKLPVYKSESSSSTTKYDLAGKPKDVTAVMYVNGVEAGIVTDKMINDYILENATGTVTLVDETEVGSTSTDGKYEYIMVDYYVDAVVESVATTSTYARINFKQSQAANKMQWDPEDEDIDVRFSGAVTDYKELQEFDVLSIAYDVVGDKDSLTDRDHYDVKVTRNVVTGTVTSRDTDDFTVRVDGSDYELVDENEISAFELSTEYTLYLDAFGYVAYFEEGNSAKNYGVIVAMYKSAGNDEFSVRMITSDAQVVAYEAKDNTEAKKFYNYAVNGNSAGNDEVEARTKGQLRDNIVAGKTVCTYKLSNGKIRFDKEISGVGGANLEYKANSNKLGSYTIAEGTTKLIDMDSYMKPENSGSTVSTLATSVFEDEALYDAYLFDKNNNGDFRFGIVFGGTATIRQESSMAVVMDVVGTTDVDGTTCTELKIARDGKEDDGNGAAISVLVDSNDIEADYGVVEGSVIAYVVGSDGYVESGELYVIANPGSSYSAMKDAILANENFAAGLNDKTTKMITDGKYAGNAVPSYGKGTSKDVVLYYGLVYKKTSNTVDLFTSAKKVGDDHVSAVNDVETLSLAGANEYVYNFGSKADYRVTAGSQTQSNSIFNRSYCTEDGQDDAKVDKNFVSWDRVVADDAKPAMALIKEVDGDVIDAIYFVAD